MVGVAALVRLSSEQQDALGDRRLARVNVGNDADIALAGSVPPRRVLGFHGFVLFLGLLRRNPTRADPVDTSPWCNWAEGLSVNGSSNQYDSARHSLVLALPIAVNTEPDNAHTSEREGACLALVAVFKNHWTHAN